MSKIECHDLDNVASNERRCSSASGPTRGSIDRSSMTSWVTSFDSNDFDVKSDLNDVREDDVDSVWVNDDVRKKPHLRNFTSNTDHGGETRSGKQNGLDNRTKSRNVNFNYVSQYKRRTCSRTSSNDSGSSNTDESSTNNHSQKVKGKHEDGFESSDQVEEVDKVKNKLMSMWNNVKYGWTMKMKTNFRYDSPIWLLGNCYHKKMDDEEMQAFVGNENRHRSHSIIYGFSQFKGDFFSRLWFTYRREFPMLAGSSLTSDCGWGCMLRSGQMMLGQGLVTHYLGRHWNWHQQQSSNVNRIHRNVIRWFGDIPSNQSPFSIHQLVSLGQSSGKKAGDWYGPASVAHIFKQAMDIAHANDPVSQEVCVYVAQDCTVYKDDLLELCSSHPTIKWRGVVIFVPVRLGGEKLNPIYIPCMRALLAHESCVGIIGGRPKHSLYFIGWQEDSLIYLDPHYCQPVVDVSTADFPVQSFHCTSPRKMPVNKMDPSCTIGFYCRTENDLNFFLTTIKDVLTPPKQKVDYPIFIVCDGKASDSRNMYHGHSDDSDTTDTILKIRCKYVNDDGEIERIVEGEEFVVL